MSQAYHLPPSEIYQLSDPVTRWSFDRAVWVFGSTVEAELREAAGSSKNPSQALFKQQQVLARYGVGKMQFRDPAAGQTAKKDTNSTGEVVTSETAGPVKL